MRKEIIAAIVAGIAFGIVVAFGIWRATSALQKETPSVVIGENEPVSEEKAIPTENELKVTIAKPEDSDVVTQSPTMLTGITKAGSWVSISTEEEDFVFLVEDSGTFEQEIELIGGLNQLIIQAFNKEESSAKHVLNLVYSTEFE